MATHSVTVEDRTYEWDGELTEMTPITVNGQRPRSFGSIIGHTHGWILTAFREAGVLEARV